jgi:hypothetical protein
MASGYDISKIVMEDATLDEAAYKKYSPLLQ